MPEQVIVETTGHRSCDGVRENKCTSSTLKRKASEILQGATPKKAEIDVKEKNEKGLTMMLSKDMVNKGKKRGYMG